MLRTLRGEETQTDMVPHTGPWSRKATLWMCSVVEERHIRREKASRDMQTRTRRTWAQEREDGEGDTQQTCERYKAVYRLKVCIPPQNQCIED